MKDNRCSIAIDISFGFFCALALAVYFGRGVMEFLLACAVHELGHLSVLAVMKCRTINIRFGCLGVYITPNYRFMPKRKTEIVMLLAGPLLGIAAALGAKNTFFEFYKMSLLLSLVNLLPFNGLDGGSVMKLLCGCNEKHKKLLFIGALGALMPAFALVLLKATENIETVFAFIVIAGVLLFRHFVSNE